LNRLVLLDDRGMQTADQNRAPEARPVVFLASSWAGLPLRMRFNLQRGHHRALVIAQVLAQHRRASDRAGLALAFCGRIALPTRSSTCRARCRTAIEAETTSMTTLVSNTVAGTGGIGTNTLALYSESS